MSFNGRDNANMKRPAPSSGFSDFPRLGQHASMSDSNVVSGPKVMAPTVKNNVFHLAANPNATYPLFCGAFSTNWQLGYREGMPLFVNMQHAPNKDSRSTLTGRHQSQNILASIPVLNFYLTIGSSSNGFVQRFVKKYQINDALIPRGPTDEELRKRVDEELSLTNMEEGQQKEEIRAAFGAEKRSRLKDQMFIENFVAKWRFMGVILSDMDVSSRFQKLFNLNVRGRSRVFNLWSTRENGKFERKTARDRVQKGDTLYLSLEKVPVDETTYLQPDGTTMAIIPQSNDENTVWQIRAKRMTHGKAPFAKRNGLYRQPQLNIEVGRVLNSLSKKPEEHFQRRAFRDHKQMGHLPMVEIALHTGQL